MEDSQFFGVFFFDRFSVREEGFLRERCSGKGERRGDSGGFMGNFVLMKDVIKFWM